MDDWCAIVFFGPRMLIISGMAGQPPRQNPFLGIRRWKHVPFWIAIGPVPSPVVDECRLHAGEPLTLSFAMLGLMRRAPKRISALIGACLLFDAGRKNEAEEKAFEALANGWPLGSTGRKRLVL